MLSHMLDERSTRMNTVGISGANSIAKPWHASVLPSSRLPMKLPPTPLRKSGPVVLVTAAASVDVVAPPPVTAVVMVSEPPLVTVTVLPVPPAPVGPAPTGPASVVPVGVGSVCTGSEELQFKRPASARPLTTDVRNKRRE